MRYVAKVTDKPIAELYIKTNNIEIKPRGDKNENYSESSFSPIVQKVICTTRYLVQ